MLKACLHLKIILLFRTLRTLFFLYTTLQDIIIDGAYILGKFPYFPQKANGTIKEYLDPKDLNRAIICNHHKALTLEK